MVFRLNQCELLVLFCTWGTVRVAYRIRNGGMQGVNALVNDRMSRAEGGQRRQWPGISSPASLLITQSEPKNIYDPGYCKSQHRYRLHTRISAKETSPDVSGYQPLSPC